MPEGVKNTSTKGAIKIKGFIVNKIIIKNNICSFEHFEEKDKHKEQRLGEWHLLNGLGDHQIGYSLRYSWWIAAVVFNQSNSYYTEMNWWL